MKSFEQSQGSRFAEMEEIFEIANKVDVSSSQTGAGGPVIYSDGDTAHVLNHDFHSIAFGATGSKKTRLYVAPLLAMLAKNGESMIVNDPKGELYRRFKPYLDQLGYPIHVLDFRNPTHGSRWNPFSIPCDLFKAGDEEKSDIYIRDVADCVYSELCQTTKDSFWPNNAKDYFTGLAQMVRNESQGDQLTMEAIRFANTVGGQMTKGGSYLKMYLKNLDPLSAAFMNLNETVHTADNTRKGIVSVFSQPMNLYGQESLRDMMSESDFSLADIGRQKTAVFIISPTERSVFNPIISAFVKQSYSALIDLVASQQADGMLPVRVNYVLDEFSNLPEIQDINNMITMARGANIRFNLVVQSIDQLFRSYSPEGARNIINNCEAWFVLRSKDTHLHRIVSEMCGTRFSEYSHHESPLVSSRTIQKLDKARGEVLLMISGLDPYITTLPDIDDYPFGLPKAQQWMPPAREKKARKVFDIRKVVKQQLKGVEKQDRQDIEKWLKEQRERMAEERKRKS